MLSNKLKDIFDDIDRRDSFSSQRSRIYKVFLKIAHDISRMREEQGISQRELATRLNTSHPTVNRWESEGYTGYTLSKLIEIADVLDHDIYFKFVPKSEMATLTEKREVYKVEWNSWDGDIQRKIVAYQNSSINSEPRPQNLLVLRERITI